jgi:hypothetical protein
MEIGKLLEMKRDYIFTIHEHSRMLGRERFRAVPAAYQAGRICAYREREQLWAGEVQDRLRFGKHVPRKTVTV